MRVHLRIRGRVQGVGFRFFALDTATRLGLSGWVRNLPDGGVEAEAEGDAAGVETFVSELKAGPSFARVDAVERRETPPAGGKGFEIL